jgi:hypothetical protein
VARFFAAAAVRAGRRSACAEGCGPCAHVGGVRGGEGAGSTVRGGEQPRGLLGGPADARLLDRDDHDVGLRDLRPPRVRLTAPAQDCLCRARAPAPRQRAPRRPRGGAREAETALAPADEAILTCPSTLPGANCPPRSSWTTSPSTSRIACRAGPRGGGGSQRRLLAGAPAARMGRWAGGVGAAPPEAREAPRRALSRTSGATPAAPSPGPRQCAPPRGSRSRRRRSRQPARLRRRAAWPAWRVSVHGSLRRECAFGAPRRSRSRPSLRPRRAAAASLPASSSLLYTFSNVYLLPKLTKCSAFRDSRAASGFGNKPAAMAQVPTQSLQVPMRVREDGREERTAPVLVSVSIETDRESASRRQLMVFQAGLPPEMPGLATTPCAAATQQVLAL